MRMEGREAEFNTSPELTSSDDVTREIKLEDLSKLVKNVVIESMDLDSPKDDQPFIVQDDEDEEVHVEAHAKSEDTLSRNLKLEKKADFKAEVALLSAQPSFLNVEQLTELLVKSLKPKFTKLLTDYDFNTSIPTEMKELSSKFKEISREIKDLKKYVKGLEIEIPGDLKEIPKKLRAFHSTISCLTKQLSRLKVLDALPSLLNKVTEALNGVATTIASASQTTCEQIVPSVDQVSTYPAEGEKNT
nr:hypothetical protein [Tanacetum cinerariifolium]